MIHYACLDLTTLLSIMIFIDTFRMANPAGYSRRIRSQTGKGKATIICREGPIGKGNYKLH